MKNAKDLGCARLGDRLSEVRAGAGATQQEVADAAGVSRPAISQYESGTTRPELEVIERMAAYLGVTAGWLAFGEGKGPTGKR